MSKFMKAIAAIMLTVAVVSTAGCTKEGNKNVRVTTDAPKDITQTSATISGEVEVMAEGIYITEKGVCWGTSKNPTVNDNHIASNDRSVTVTCMITGLEPSTTYYVRVYASDGTEFYYGSDQSFTTLESGGGGSSNGALNGVFSISSTERVHFSQGNLQYQASTNTWRFADNQYDYLAGNNQNISETNSGWIDLFGWGTSGWNCGNTFYHPWDIGEGACTVFGPSGEYDLTGEFAQSDWGVYNAISNGGNVAGRWRTLTIDEWKYVFLTRSTESGMHYVKANVAGVNGVILLPDDWRRNVYILYNGVNYSANVIDVEDWENVLEANGAVFLPAFGERRETSLMTGTGGYYWSTTSGNANCAYIVYFNNYNDLDLTWATCRTFGHSVRLVKDVE